MRITLTAGDSKFEYKFISEKEIRWAPYGSTTYMTSESEVTLQVVFQAFMFMIYKALLYSLNFL